MHSPTDNRNPIALQVNSISVWEAPATDAMGQWYHWWYFHHLLRFVHVLELGLICLPAVKYTYGAWLYLVPIWSLRKAFEGMLSSTQ